MSKRSWLRFLFSMEGRVDRRTYALVGFNLMGVKYAIDALLIHFVVGVLWTPLDYLSPIMTTRATKLTLAPEAFELGMALWTLPFIWIGVTMTVRRAIDAGFSPWLALLFFVPLVNYGLMIVLCLRPVRATQPDPHGWEPRSDEAVGIAPFRSALGAVFLSVAVCMGIVLLSTEVLHSYGLGLLAGTPVLLGALAGFLYNRPALHTVAETLGVVLAALGMGAGGLLLFAIEGAICILMVAPIAVLLGAMGGMVGRAIAAHGQAGRPALYGVALLPLLIFVETRVVEPAQHAVETVIEIDAPPSVVWNNVVSFSTLPPPRWLPFRLGIAHPIRARIEGEGVGAVRYCEFSTGPFVEPITVWEAPTRLVFDVVAQPAPMRELSPYEIHPPHLDHFIRSKRGEFRLEPLPGGRTRLVGTTWYELRIEPAAYFRLWSEGFIHGIHQRVLEHVADLSTRPR